MASSDSNGPLSVLYSFPHAIGLAGIGWTAYQQVRGLIDAGHRVTVVTASTAASADLSGAERVVTTLEVRGRRIPHRAIGRDRAFALHDLRAARILSGGRFDVVHAWPLAARRTLSQARRLGIAGLREAPNTHTAYAWEVVADEYSRLGIPMPPRSPHTFNAAHLSAELAEWHAATAVLTPSDAVRRTFLGRGFDPARLIRHRYGTVLGPTPSETVPERPFTAVFVGRIEPRKGLHYALDAWIGSTAAADGGRLLVYGAFTDGYREVLGDRLRAPGVEVRGFTDDVASVFAGADVLVLPSIEEGSALVSYEAQAAGCVPLVSTAAGALVNDGVDALLHAPRDVATLREQLDLLAGDPAKLSELRAAGIARRAELSWEAAALALAAAYRDAIALTRAETEVGARGSG